MADAKKKRVPAVDLASRRLSLPQLATFAKEEAHKHTANDSLSHDELSTMAASETRLV